MENLSLKRTYKGKIVDVYKENINTSHIIQGVKKNEQPSYDRKFYGSNGSYSTGSELFRCLFIKVVVFDFPEKNKSMRKSINERDFLLEYFKKSNITEAFVAMIKDKLKGKKIKLHYKPFNELKEDENDFQIDKEELRQFLV